MCLCVWVCVGVCVLVLPTSKVRTFIRREDILAGPHVLKGLLKGRLDFEVGVSFGLGQEVSWDG